MLLPLLVVTPITMIDYCCIGSGDTFDPWFCYPTLFFTWAATFVHPCVLLSFAMLCSCFILDACSYYDSWCFFLLSSFIILISLFSNSISSWILLRGSFFVYHSCCFDFESRVPVCTMYCKRVSPVGCASARTLSLHIQTLLRRWSNN